MTPLNEPFDVRSSNTKHLKRGGLRHLERFLGLRLDNVLSTDAVFISLDLEVSSDQQKLHLSTDEPLVTQVGFASLDTRDFASLNTSSDLKSLISVHMYQTEVPPKSKKAARKQERECIFAQTQRVSPEKVPAIIVQNLRIQDSSGPNATSSQLRAVVLVGHSIREDLKILHFLGIDVPPYHPNLPTLPGQTFSLMGVLAQLGYRPQIATFHNAGNDAVYSLHAMLLLAVRNGTASKAELSARELINLDTIKHAVSQIQTHYSLMGTDA